MWSRWLLAWCLLGLFACGTPKRDNAPAKIVLTDQLHQEANRLYAAGFHTLAGKLPLAEQLAESWRYQREKDPSGEARYFVVSVKSAGDTFESARLQAESLAKVQLAGLMETRIAQLVTNRMESSDGDTRMKTVASSKHLVTTRLSNVYPLLEIYKECQDGKIEVQLVMGCDRRWASEIAWAVISAEAAQHTASSQAFSFSLDGLKQAYRSGESLHFSLTADQDCYYHLFVFDADGVELIYPGEYEPGQLHKKGRKYSFPRNQWIAYSIEKSDRSTRYEQNVMLVVATRQEVAFKDDVTVANVLGWLRGLPDEMRSERYYSFLTE